MVMASIDGILGHFIVKMKAMLKQQGYAYLQKFVINFKKGLVAEKMQQNYCQSNNGSDLPHMFNNLIIHNRLII